MTAVAGTRQPGSWRPEFEADTVWALLRERARLTPDGLFAVDEHRRVLTFAELRAAVERTAAGLTRLGIRPGDVVSWQLPNGFDTITLSLALARLGAVQNPLIMMLRERDLTFICRQAGTRWLVVPGEFRGTDHAAMAAAVAGQLPGLQVLSTVGGLPTADPAHVRLPPEPGSPAVGSEVRWLFYTSGTTSDPKGARHSDRTLIAASDTFCANLHVTSADQTATLLPLAHVGGVAHILTSLRTGSSMVTSAVFDPVATVDLLREQRITLLGSGLPFVRAYLARQRAEPGTRLFPHVRATLFGGAGRPASIHEEIKRELGGVGAVSGYGLTECPYLTWGTPEDSDRAHATAEGRPGPGGEIRVLRSDGSAAGTGEEGELRVRAPQLMLGYVDSALDADAFDDQGFFRTGDLGFVDGEGVLTVTGRIKDIIIRKMENISAREVEEHLITHPAVADVAVIGLPDPETGERACAVVVPVDPDAPPTLAALTGHLAARGLSTRKFPEQLEVLGDLPRNAMGKVVKRELTSRYGGAR
ncbi:class I adenylate-forming enzyme family protein [Trujillonella humicola]|uniref:class I adenylate-forming enzyme family protein n=1 Tax=Trujillonella humicola TaxID=3383699 RepID=UPI003905A7B3